MGQALMTAPASCPRSRCWISRLTINYDDGPSETATSVTPCSR
jgi:hypothetical protein